MGLHSTGVENSSVNQPVTFLNQSAGRTEVGIVGYWRYLAVVLKQANYIIYVSSIYWERYLYWYFRVEAKYVSQQV